MGSDNAKSFDDEVRNLLESFGEKGERTVRMKVSASIIWAKTHCLTSSTILRKQFLRGRDVCGVLETSGLKVDWRGFEPLTSRVRGGRYYR
jgi:hypothetical protein